MGDHVKVLKSLEKTYSSSSCLSSKKLTDASMLAQFIVSLIMLDEGGGKIVESSNLTLKMYTLNHERKQNTLVLFIS